MTKTPLLISIIDDDEIHQFMLTRIINTHKLADKILSFPDGEKAYHYLRDNISIEENIPDVIFLDNSMPIMDGYQFIEEYAKLENEIKKKVLIFMVSSSVNEIDIDRAKKINQISDYFIKPIETEEVKEILENLENF